MKKILGILLIGIISGSIVTYGIVILGFKKQTQEAPKVPQSLELENLQYTINEKDSEIKNLDTQNYKLQKENLNLLKSTSKMLKFDNDELGFSFLYPSWFGKLNFSIHDGEAGKKFEGNFENVALSFGGTTKNFEQGREGMPTDYKGNDIFDKKYFGNMSEQIAKTISVSGGEVTLLKGSGEEGPGNWFPEGTFGALVKLSGPKFYGLSFVLYQQNDQKKMTVDEFESMLKTIVIK